MTTSTAPTVQDLPVASLRPHPDNPRRGDPTRLAISILRNGWYGTVVAQAPNRRRRHHRILAGEHRWRGLQLVNDLDPEHAAELLDLADVDEAARYLERARRTTVPVYVLDVDDETALRVLLVDNAESDAAGYDEPALAALLSSLADSGGLVGTGYDDAALATLVAALADDATSRPTPDAFDDVELGDVKPLLTHTCPRCSYVW